VSGMTLTQHYSSPSPNFYLPSSIRGPLMSEHVIILEPGRAEKNYWQDLWRYRELFLILAWRDVAVRYKQTIIGVVYYFRQFQ
jgi:lipopolysaccharide transport system permease protein